MTSPIASSTSRQPPAVPSMMREQTAIVDETAVERLRGFGGEKLVRGMVELFVQNAPLRASEAREAFDCGDAAALRAALHGLKSSAGQLGAGSVYAACVAGEELASRGELGPCAVHLERIETDLPLVCRYLDDLRSDAA